MVRGDASGMSVLCHCALFARYVGAGWRGRDPRLQYGERFLHFRGVLPWKTSRVASLDRIVSWQRWERAAWRRFTGLIRQGWTVMWR